MRVGEGRRLTSVAAVKGIEVRCVTAQRFALLRSQLILFEPLQQNAALDSPPKHLCTMSFDLGVWHATRALNSDTADAVYQAACEGAALPSDGRIAPSPRIAAFIAELGAQFPDLDSLSDYDVDASPWASGFENTDQYAIFNIRWSAAKTMLTAFRALAAKHELVLYDPQTETVYNPPSLQSVPAWQFWRR